MKFPNSIGIFYFSGTGNTKIVTNLLKNKIINKGVDVDVIAIDDLVRRKTHFNKNKLNSYELIGIGYPVHAFNAPKIVFDFIKSLPSIKRRKTFVFKTSGDPLCNGGSTSMIRKQLKNRGLNVFHESLIVMPANLAIMYQDELIKQLYNVAVRKINIIVQQILRGKEKFQKNNFILTLISKIFSKMEGLGAKYFGKYLITTDACNLCQICINNCPMGNIKINGKKLWFDNKCIFCLRCVYNCPQDALSNKYFKFIILKDGYDICKVINNPNIKENYITTKTKGYFKHFYKNITNF